jgi:hypothetical protein
MNGGTVTPDALARAVEAFGYVIGGILGVCIAIVSVAKAVEVLRGLKKPAKDVKDRVECAEKRLDGIDDRLESGNERFERQDQVNASLKEGQRVMCVGLQALLTSAQFGNNEAGLRGAATELNAYLTRR